MRDLVLHLPDDLDIDDQSMTVFLAAKLYEGGKLSMSKAAEMAGMSYKDFMLKLSSFNVPVFNYSDQDLAKEFDNISRHYR